MTKNINYFYRCKVKNHLTLKERYLIRDGLDANLTYKEIAESMGRSKSTVLREAKRLGFPDDYDAILAHRDFKKKQMLSGIRKDSPLYLKIQSFEVDDDDE